MIGVPGVLGEEATVLSCPDEHAAPYVKVNAFRTVDEEPGRIVVHVVNYNTELGVEAEEPEAIEGIELAVPLPDGRRVASAMGHAPGEAEPVRLDAETRDDVAHISLPPVSIYRVVEVALAE